MTCRTFPLLGAKPLKTTGQAKTHWRLKKKKIKHDVPQDLIQVKQYILNLNEKEN